MSCRYCIRGDKHCIHKDAALIKFTAPRTADPFPWSVALPTHVPEPQTVVLLTHAPEPQSVVQLTQVPEPQTMVRLTP